MTVEVSNRVSAELKEETIKEIEALVQQIEDKISFLTNISTDDRGRLPRVGRGQRLFIESTMRVAREKSEILPEYVDIDELQKDLELYNALGKVLAPVSRLQNKVWDTQVLAGAEAYTSALVVYNMFQMAAKMGVVGIDSAVLELAQYYSSQNEE